jgi:hypothetical protein
LAIGTRSGVPVRTLGTRSGVPVKEFLYEEDEAATNMLDKKLKVTPRRALQSCRKFLARTRLSRIGE